MKKTRKNLALTRETVRSLSGDEAGEVVGGAPTLVPILTNAPTGLLGTGLLGVKSVGDVSAPAWL